MANIAKKKRRLSIRRKRTLDPNIVIDYKNTDMLKRFVTDRGKVIPRRISGATARQQRLITLSVKRARYLALLPYTVSHRTERTTAAFEASIAPVGFGSATEPKDNQQADSQSNDEET